MIYLLYTRYSPSLGLVDITYNYCHGSGIIIIGISEKNKKQVAQQEAQLRTMWPTYLWLRFFDGGLDV